jgi:hypothetical protein
MPEELIWRAHAEGWPGRPDEVAEVIALLAGRLALAARSAGM